MLQVTFYYFVFGVCCRQFTLFGGKDLIPIIEKKIYSCRRELIPDNSLINISNPLNKRHYFARRAISKI